MLNYTNYVWDSEKERWIDLSGTSGVKIYYDLKSSWDMQKTLVGEKNAIYVYTDYKTIYDDLGNVVSYVPNIKIGDGKAYLVDIPFISTDEDIEARKDLQDHINDLSVHITQAERQFWNNKCRVYESDVDGETIVFTTK